MSLLDPLLALPLIAAVSLVYAGTRHESFPAIRAHALRMAWMIFLFMGGIFLLIQLLNWWAG